MRRILYWLGKMWVLSFMTLPLAFVPNAPLLAQSSLLSREYLTGHWIYTSVDLEESVDEHIVFGANGQYRHWSKRVDWQSDMENGYWKIGDRIVVLQSADGAQISVPITIYKGDLVLPNVEGERKIWSRMSN